MVIQLIHQQPTELALAVARQDLSTGFRRLKSRQVIHDNWRLTFDIIGESHVVTLRQDERLILQEILACVDVPPAVCLHHQSFTQLDSHVYADDVYQAWVSFADAQPAPPPDDTYTLEYAFPPTWGVTPVTRVQWQLNETDFRWWTLHVYPAEQGTTFVHTYSQFNHKER